MLGNILVRIENHGIPAEERQQRLLRALEKYDDAQLLRLASRRDRQEPKRDLRAVMIALPPAAMQRILRLPDGEWHVSVSALVDRLLEQKPARTGGK